MSRARPSRDGLLLPIALGTSDGILNALTLASAAVLHGSNLTVDLAIRIGIAAVVTATFTVYVAVYAQLRAELARAEHELNQTSSGRLAASNLGRATRVEASTAAVVAGLSSLLGAVLPLVLGVLLGGASWVALVLAVLALGGLGGVLATQVNGNRATWTAALIVGGIVVAAIGAQLNIA